MREKKRVLMLCHPQLIPPATLEGYTDKEILYWRTEYDVASTLLADGHEVRVIGVQFELQPIRKEIEEWKPDIVFNLLDEFHGETLYCQNVVSFLELLRVPYTGCNPRGMMLCQGKDLSKKLLKYHRVPVPEFAVFPLGHKARKPRRLRYPLIVKSLIEDASRGISQNSVVYDDKELAERVGFVHERLGTAAIAEQYIEGREIYVGVFGSHDRRRILPVWELHFNSLPQGALPIATERAKFDPTYQARTGVEQGPAKDLAPNVVTNIRKMVTRICQTLEIDGYARIDFRLTPEGVPYFIEANPNPEIAKDEEFAQSALFDGIEYPELLNRILGVGIKRHGVDNGAE